MFTIKDVKGKVIYTDKQSPTFQRAIERAVADGINLSNAKLTNGNLPRTNLPKAKLSGANLVDANLSEADLSGADLSGADLSKADLVRTNLTGANLSGANLTGSNLTYAKLINTNLTNVRGYEKNSLSKFSPDKIRESDRKSTMNKIKINKSRLLQIIQEEINAFGETPNANFDVPTLKKMDKHITAVMGLSDTLTEEIPEQIYGDLEVVQSWIHDQVYGPPAITKKSDFPELQEESAGGSTNPVEIVALALEENGFDVKVLTGGVLIKLPEGNFRLIVKKV